MAFYLADDAGVRLTGLSEGGALVVGRSAECALALTDPTVSRRHAELIGARDHLVVHDLGSRNGTFRNGVRVQTARLRAGDEVTFGVVALRVERDPDAQDGAEPLLRDLAGRASPSRGALGTSPQRTSASGESGSDPGDGPQIVAERGAAAPQELTARRLALLLEAVKALGGAADAATVQERVVKAALRTLDADRAAVLRVADGETDAGGAPVLVPGVARDRWEADLTAGNAAPLPRSVARVAMARRAALLSVDAAADPRFGGQSVLLQRVRSAMCAPLFAADGAPLGALYVDSADPVRAFTEADLDFLTAFAGVAAASLENARMAERLRREAVSRENFARYFAPPVAARIAASDAPALPGGERRTVAVLFADLRGFTPLAATMTPDDVAATLSEFLSAMVDCVFRHGGTLDKFIGDCVMAQWGAPEPAEDDADRALRAAAAMHEALGALNRERAGRGRPALRMGVGVAYGDVFAGNIGSERRLEFTVIGDAVNQASHLCDSAGPGEILISDALRRALHAPPDPALPPLRERPLAARGDGSAATAIYVVDCPTPSGVAGTDEMPIPHADESPAEPGPAGPGVAEPSVAEARTMPLDEALLRRAMHTGATPALRGAPDASPLGGSPLGGSSLGTPPLGDAGPG